MLFIYSKTRRKLQKGIELINDLYEGNYSLDENKEKYLFKFPAESDENYERRKQRSVFYNFLEPLINLASERPFSSEVTYIEEFPEEFEKFKLSFSSSGASLLKTSNDILVSALKYGSVLVVSDYDEEAECPYARIIPIEDVIAVESGYSSGESFIQKVQFIVRKIELIKETTGGENAQEKFVEYERSKIISMEHPNIIKEYSIDNEDLVSITNNKLIGSFGGSVSNYLNEIKATLINEKTLEGFEKLPVNIFQAGKLKDQSDLIGVIPPFYDLAKLNVSHFNKQAECDNLISVSNFAILCFAGFTEQDIENLKSKDKKITLGPNSVVMSESSDTKVYYAEHSGGSIQSSQSDILKTEKAMVSILTRYLERTTMETATEKNLDEKNKRLFLVYLANILEKIVSNILRDFAIYTGYNRPLPDTNLLSFSADYDPQNTKLKIDALIEARKIGDLSLGTFLAELSSNKIFSSSFVPQEEEEKLSAEAIDFELDNNPLVNNEDNENNDEEEES